MNKMNRMFRQLLIIILFFLILLLPIYAHGDIDDGHNEKEDKEPFVLTPPNLVKIVSVWVLIITIFLFSCKKQAHKHKHLFFWILAIPIIAASLYLAIDTIQHNVTSVTKGPVHWHADYQVWTCDEQLDLIDPKGLKNKIGNPVFHEHNDGRIHVEGAVQKLEDVNLKNYFNAIGGQFSNDKVSYPTNDGLVTYQNGETCNQEPSTLKVYVNGKIVENPATYVLTPHTQVPPGDCIIIEFSPQNNPTTEKICNSWLAMDQSY
jgi:hypothetical protein